MSRRWSWSFSLPMRPGAVARSYPAWLEWLGRLVPARFRWLHCRYARAFGFFWLPCPLCGREFGGHQWRDVNGLPSSVPEFVADNAWRAVGICPACTRAGKGSV